MAVIDPPATPADLPGLAADALEPTRARSRTLGVATVTSLVIAFGGAIVLYAVFIARTAFHFGGRTYFSLFDDSMISMRYAENLAHGHGLVWNAGSHPVEGYTNFLWTLYMALVHLLPISIGMTSLAVMITGAVLLVGTAIVVGAIARLLVPESRLVLVLAVAGTLFFYPLVYWTLRGMEVGLAAFVISLMVLLALRLARSFSIRTLLGIAVLGAMAVLVRDDLILPALVVIGYAIMQADRTRRRRVAMTLLGTLLATVAAHTAFRLAYYGNALPNTYYLKLQGASLATRLTRGVLTIAGTYSLTLFAPCALAAAALARPWRRRDPRVLLLAAVVAVAFLYTAYVGGDAWEEFRFADRYLTAAAPLLFILAAIGVRRLLLLASETARRARLVPFGLLGLGAVLAALPAHTMNHWLSDGTWSSSLGAIARRAVLPAAAALLLGGLVYLRGRRVRTAAVGAVIAGAVLLVGLPNAGLYRQWRYANAQQVSGENFQAQAGLALARITRPGDSVAMAAAGALPYFSGRPGVDLLGFSDAHVAHEAPKAQAFHPGHTKWDYGYSFGTLRPAVVYQLYQDPATARRELAGLGYVVARIDFAPSEALRDHLLPWVAIYVSPGLATRVRQQTATAGRGTGGLAWLQLAPSGSAERP